MSAMERALMRAQPPIHRSNSMNGPLRRDLSKEQKRQMQADISPENVRDRVLAPRRYSQPISKLGDARTIMSPHRNVEKMFGYFSDHPEQEALPPGLNRQNTRENLYRTYSPPPVPVRVRSSSTGRPRTADSSGSQYSGSVRDGSMSDRSSIMSGRWSASKSPPKMRGSAKWAVPGHGHMALWGNVTQPHVSPKASWRQAWDRQGG
eukprot:CAMPEP_0179474582 /NCGR_PEP_ID=MMETSP0799-20121207/54005_1 /TAXON_ID=46947 /ORGANISM="Geminigera cryophila, Strain CCMP2564" /LENGTH=205 /DNA_ID=CAMNT_0021283723 /DNA_START=191 /DNA_END=804 /DNA_ORIENTATION=+